MSGRREIPRTTLWNSIFSNSQETLEDPRMETGENTLLLICEEGVEEYEPEKFVDVELYKF